MKAVISKLYEIALTPPVCAISMAIGISAAAFADDYYVSPCDRDGTIDFATAKSVLSRLDGWSLSVQLHKLLGFR